MTLPTLSLALLALLLSPGPTNTLLALGGATLGYRRALPLIAVALAGYAVAIAPLVHFGWPFLNAHPHVALGVTLAAGAWVLVLAFGLWTKGAGSSARPLISSQKVFVTTMLNPKALVIGLALIPAVRPESFWPAVAVFAALLSGCSAVWIGVGAAFGMAGSRGLPPLVLKGAALYLTVVAVGLVANDLRTLG